MAHHAQATNLPTTSPQAQSQRDNTVIALACFVLAPFAMGIAFAVIRCRRKAKRCHELPRYQGRDIDLRSRRNSINPMALPDHPSPVDLPSLIRKEQQVAAAEQLRRLRAGYLFIRYDNPYPLARLQEHPHRPTPVAPPPPTPVIAPSSRPSSKPDIPTLELPPATGSSHSISSIPTEHDTSSLPPLERQGNLFSTPPESDRRIADSSASDPGCYRIDIDEMSHLSPSAVSVLDPVANTQQDDVASAPSVYNSGHEPSVHDSGYHSEMDDDFRELIETANAGAERLPYELDSRVADWLDRVPPPIEEPIEEIEQRYPPESDERFLYNGSPASSVHDAEVEMSPDQEVDIAEEREAETAWSYHLRQWLARGGGF